MFAAPLWRMLEGQVIKDQYHLQQVLGAGTFGGVFRTDQVVRDTVLRTLATKVIFINQPELVSYQLQELQIALSLDHPHLLRCYDAGDAHIKALSSSCLYLLMELAEETLENRVQRGNIVEEEVEKIVKEIAQGLIYLHEKEQVHLDLKPANILKVSGHWKIGDYGLVRSLNSTRSYAETVHLLGTPLFSPPESYQGILSPAWDMWSLGILTVMLLINRYPIRYETQYELQTKVSNANFDNLNWDDLKEPWQKVIEGCLQVNRQQRWTAKQVLSALQPPVIQFASPLVSSSPSPQVLILDLPNNVKLEMIKIPAGNFLMGSTKAEVNRLNQTSSLMNVYSCELPQHRVTLQEYYLGKYPVTQEQYQAVMGSNPSHFKNNPTNPVECVSWNDAQEFCQKIYEKTGQKVRLPSEAEWEYGCRAGTTTSFYFGNNISTEQANYDGSGSNFSRRARNSIYRQTTTPVGSFPANKFGLYDMHGNVWEWCEDSWHESYKEKPEKLKQNGNITWSAGNESRYVLRGGSWYATERVCRSAFRDWCYENLRKHDDGFRLALSIQANQTSEPTIIQFATPPVFTSPSSSNPQALILDLPNNIKLEMLKIPAGSFLMGSTEAEVKRLNQEYSTDQFNCELPQHRVTLQEYYLGKYPVTQEQYQAVMSNNSSYFKDNPKHPVVNVFWDKAKAFCHKIYDLTGQKVRLPTEAEWEYGCRAGTTTPFYFGETISPEQANYRGNYTFEDREKEIYWQTTTPVGSFPGNKFGLYDMHGNVWEWCEDNWHNNYKEKPETLKQNGNIIWLSSSQYHVMRGGYNESSMKDCRSSMRKCLMGRSAPDSLGFRVALCPP